MDPFGQPPAGRRPVPFRGGGFNPTPRRVLPWIVFLVVIAGWQAASISSHLSCPM